MIEDRDLEELKLKSERERALRWIKTEPNAPKHFTKSGNELSRETITNLIMEYDVLQAKIGELIRAGDAMEWAIISGGHSELTRSRIDWQKAKGE